MIIREAKIEDIKQIRIIRNSVNENKVSHPSKVTDKDCAEYLQERGKGWVSVIGHQMVGFSIVDLKENNIWALFLHPDFEKRGIGKQLHDIMLDRYFTQTKHKVWFRTTPKTRAETFYRKSGRSEVGIHGNDEIKSEMTFETWEKLHVKPKEPEIRAKVAGCKNSFQKEKSI